MGMLFAQYISAAAPHPNAAKVAIDFFFSDEGQVLLARGYAHPSRKVALPADVAGKMLPESAYGKIHFPSGLPAFSAAIKKIADGRNAIVGQSPACRRARRYGARAGVVSRPRCAR